MNQMYIVKVTDTEGRSSYIEENSIDGIIGVMLVARRNSNTYRLFESITKETDDQIDKKIKDLLAGLK